MASKSTFKPFRPLTLKDSVYRELFRAIVSGRIEPGERLVLETLANQLGVSIMPVREAIRKLEANRLVRTRNRKIVVSELSPQSVRDILKVRLLLEGYAAAEAARTRREEAVPRLVELLEVFGRTGDVEEYMEANRSFHRTVYEECRNPALLEVLDSLWERYSPYLHIFLDGLSDWRLPDSDRNHERIVEAVRDRDAGAARKWTERDLVEAADNVLDAMAARGGKGAG